EYSPVIVTKRVIWQLPFTGLYKCNTDGASRGNPGPSSYGFCVRNEERDLVCAKAQHLEEMTNIVVEVKAIEEGLSYCVAHDLHPLLLETDSLGIKNVIDGDGDHPWCIGAEVKRIKEMKKHFNVLF
uniref:Uncharacterized protein LOC104226894 n=1 Tax=Nicotiana sylvestris TaxID=4096 RepID=A0A1U7WSS4_NICSY